ncbi:MAG: FKBP-type peptidyl-prolyl cis-trans isomerase [Bacteroidales bacterium]
MKTNKLIQLSLTLFFVITTACVSTTEDPSVTYEKWKKDNEDYFKNMKDSASYRLCDIPVNRGGGSFYSKIIKKGDSLSICPISTDTVLVNYRGIMLSGYIFDQTYIGQNPVSDFAATPRYFVVKKLIAGFSEALMQMKVGEFRRVVLPQDLCYGASGVSIIPPYSTLVFDIQLIAIGVRSSSLN